MMRPARAHGWPCKVTVGGLYLMVFGATRTMAINAPVISGSDPGAVPGGSTNTPSLGAEGAETGSTNV